MIHEVLGQYMWEYQADTHKVIQLSQNISHTFHIQIPAIYPAGYLVGYYPTGY